MNEMRAARFCLRPRGLALMAALILICGGLSAAPGAPQNFPSPIGERPPDPFGDAGRADPMIAARQMHALNVDRQRKMVADAARLLQLARQLNEEVAAGTSNSLTPAEVRKVAEIGKLARKVKQEMVFSVGGGPQAPELFQPSVR
jgi:hypothetical protein